MKFFALFIYRPVATILLSVAITLCGILGFRYAAGCPAAAGRFSGDYGQRLAARCVAGDNGVFRCHAAGALTWAHCRG